MMRLDSKKGRGGYLYETCFLTLRETQRLYLQDALAKYGLRIYIGSGYGGG